MDKNGIILAAHRGDRKNCPENTMPAFIASLNAGVEMIETDIHMTKDGELVIMHDRSALRTAGVDRYLDEMTLAEVMELDAGYLFSEDFRGTRVPTVREFIEWIKDTPLLINWELKQYPLELGEEKAYGCIDKLVEMIDRYGLAERSLMNSFSDCNLEYVDTKWPHKFAIHGYIHYKKPKDFASKPLEGFLDWAAMWNKDETHPAGFETDYAYAKERDILTCILVQDTPEQYKMALDMGCRMFTSDDPATAIEVLKQLNER